MNISSVSILSLLCLFLLCNACSDNQEGKVVTVTSFPQTLALTAQVKTVPVPFLLPRYIGIADDQLFVYKEREKDLFEFFSLPDCVYMGSAGTRGSGPDEFVSLLDPRGFQKLDSGFGVFESRINIFKTLKYQDGNLEVVQTENVMQPEQTNGYYPLQDGTFVTLGNLIESKEYFLYDGKKQDVIQKIDYPQWISGQEEYDGITLTFAYMKQCGVHPEHNKFAAFYTYFKRLRIYDKDMTLRHDVDIKIEPYNTNFVAGEDNRKSPLYYTGQPQTVSNLIYALCLNAEAGGAEAKCNPELHVFDWDGNPVACYKLDRRVSLFTISEKHKKIYAIDNLSDSGIYIYDLPEIK